MILHRPIPLVGTPRPPDARRIAGGLIWFASVAIHRRDRPPELRPISEIDPATLDRLSRPRADIAGLTLDRPRLMGVLNVTPDSFSDGGRHLALVDALDRARAMIAAGADIIDVGGESTRPGAEPVPEAEELARTIPVIAALRAEGITTPISIDTRKAAVASAAFTAGADLFNDVSALTYDPASLKAAAAHPVCLMHALGDPRTMQRAPAYEDVLLDVCDYLSARLATVEAAGIPRARVLVDPGIGFGKTLEHNLTLLRNLAAFHDLGCGILLGVSRKSFIGRIGNAPDPADRFPGSIAVALEGLRQGAQVLRLHDVAETRQAVALWAALNRDAEA